MWYYGSVCKSNYLDPELIKYFTVDCEGFLKNFYLNKGYYDVSINSSFAKLLAPNEFEIIYNINFPSINYVFLYLQVISVLELFILLPSRIVFLYFQIYSCFFFYKLLE